MQITREAGPVKGGKTNIAFAEDPTGYKFELIERAELGKENFAQVMLRVSDLDKSIAYYENCLGLTLLRKRENPGAAHAAVHSLHTCSAGNTRISLGTRSSNGN